MKIFVHILITMAAWSLSSVALADSKTQIITGRVVKLSEYEITVQSGKKRVEIYVDAKFTERPKIGDTVRVYYKPVEPHYRFDPDYEATKIEVIAAGGAKK
jgi:hypothetical protein